ncbi:QueT transporter family protein [Anaerotalea alkaliphila]|uniref:QueT transporter family protein n=1 Tax=Anaerotalea alkaliphila TaxID=2662126 RepID=A0A7X5HU56_9FIRM|nr:QueT transporter family protein [Anaerotalea alkaliphila]NDL66725.1 QueT transporter family protein [Anaerotalea alkaliphila]
MKKKSNYVADAGVIAALYVVLVLVFAPISFGPVQFRVAEALTVLPFFTPAAIPGLFVGCLAANFLGGAVLWDTLFGSLATLLAAYLSYRLRANKWLVPVPPVVVNAVVVGLIIRYAYGAPEAVPFLMGTVFIGQLGTAYGLGMLLLHLLQPIKNKIFKSA